MGLFEQEVKTADVFSHDEMIDVIGATNGKGFKIVVTRRGVASLARKSHFGLRKVERTGSWHPVRVQFQVPCSGQHSYHHRTEVKKIYRMGKSLKEDPDNVMAENNLTEKSFAPVCSFSQVSVMVKGTIMGCRRSLYILRESSLPQGQEEGAAEVHRRRVEDDRRDRRHEGRG